MNAALAECRLCRQPTNRLATRLTGMPRWNHRLLSADEVENDRPADLSVHRCESCGFVSLGPILGDDYYSDYLNAPSSSAQQQDFQAGQAREFVQRFKLANKLVLEIGCGDGYFLDQLRAAGGDCFGIEPSDAQRKLALERGLRVEGGILTEDRVLPEGPFDAFATRQVLEHVEDMHGFLRAIRRHLKPTAVGLVEVPQLETLLDGQRFFDFIPEHVNYFSRRTLRLVLEMAGFEVLSVDPVQDDEALRALVRCSEHPALDGLAGKVKELREDIARFVQRHRARGEAVAVWGAGGKGLSILAIADLKDIDLIVDSDPQKIGRFTPVSHRRIESTQALLDRKIGAVIITAPAYRKEILQTLQTKFGFQGSVGIVGQSFQVVDPPSTKATS
jgi:SAM-dependent methyltransferase